MQGLFHLMMSATHHHVPDEKHPKQKLAQAKAKGPQEELHDLLLVSISNGSLKSQLKTTWFEVRHILTRSRTRRKGWSYAVKHFSFVPCHALWSDRASP